MTIDLIEPLKIMFDFGRFYPPTTGFSWYLLIMFAAFIIYGLWNGIGDFKSERLSKNWPWIVVWFVLGYLSAFFVIGDVFTPAANEVFRIIAFVAGTYFLITSLLIYILTFIMWMMGVGE